MTAPKTKKPAVKKPVAKKPVTKKPVTKKPVAKKPVPNQPVPTQPVAKKPVAKKPVAKQPVAKTPAPTGAAPTHAALAAPKLAGDAHMRPGFAITEDDDRLFALGYPHLILLAPGHPDERELEASALACFGVCPYREVWPAALAAPMVRMMPRWREVWGPGPKGKPQFSGKGIEILRMSKPLEAGEARESFDLVLGARGMTTPFILRTLFLAESLLGADATAAFLGALEALPTEAFHRHNVNLYIAVERLSVMLLRAPPATANLLRERVQALFGRVAPSGLATRTEEETRPVRALDMVLNGEAGVNRTFPKGVGVGSLAFTPLPSEAVLEQMRKAKGPSTADPDARRVFLAGAEALDIEMGWLDDYAKESKTNLDIIIETYGKIRDERAGRLVEAAARKKSKR